MTTVAVPSRTCCADATRDPGAFNTAAETIRVMTAGPIAPERPPAGALTDSRPLLTAIRAEDRPVRSAVPAREAVRRGESLRPIMVGSLAAFGCLLALVREGQTSGLDVRITKALQASHGPAYGKLMHAVSWPGFPPQSRVIPPLVAVAWMAAGLPVEATCQILGWGSAGLSTLVKAFVRRPRPLPTQVVVVIAPLGGSSFPSGHVLTYCGVYGVAGYLLATRVRSDPGRIRAAAVPLGLVALVGPSRIQQGHHWPSDVAASYLLGIAWVAGIATLHRWLLRSVRA